MTKRLKFVRIPKSTLRKIEERRRRLKNCEIHKKLTQEKIAKAEVDRANLARSAAEGYTYSANNLEDCCTFLNSQREKLAALQEVEDSVKAEIASLEHPPAEEAAARRRNQQLAVKVERERRAGRSRLKSAVNALSLLLANDIEASSKLTSYAETIGLEMGSSQVWLTGESARTLLRALSAFDPVVEDENHLPHFIAELEGRDLPPVPAPAPVEQTPAPIDSAAAHYALMKARNAGRHLPLGGD